MLKIVGVIAGLVALMVIVVLVQMLGPVLHPIAEGTNPTDTAALARWVASAPLAAQGVVVLAWFLGAVGGGWAALRISGWLPAAWIIAVLDAAMAVANIFRFEHPLWMQIGAVAAPLLGGWIVTRYLRGQPALDDPIDG